MVAKCPAENTASIDQEKFWDGNFDAHKIGWIISGAAAAITCVIALIAVLGHARNYRRPLEQRQIIRILLFAPVFAVVSFFSYRFFRAYTYYELAEVAYEAFAIAAFLMLLLQYIGDDVEEQHDVFEKKDKLKLPLPFCCWRYRPSKPYFLHLLKWSVVQYVIVRPALSIAGIVLEYYEILCTQSLSPKYGQVWLTAIDFVSISIALYGLIVLYGLTKEDLKGKRPLAKFLTIKLAIFFTFYQSFVFSILQDHDVIHGTTYWTATNVSDGLNALCTSCEMVLVAAFQLWAFPWSEYKNVEDAKKRKTSIFKSLVHAFNFSDFFVELWHSIRFGIDRIRGKEYTRSSVGKFDFVETFAAEGSESRRGNGDTDRASRFVMYSRDGDGGRFSPKPSPRPSRSHSNLRAENADFQGGFHPGLALTMPQSQSQMQLGAGGFYPPSKGTFEGAYSLRPDPSMDTDRRFDETTRSDAALLGRERGRAQIPISLLPGGLSNLANLSPGARQSTGRYPSFESMRSGGNSPTSPVPTPRGPSAPGWALSGAGVGTGAGTGKGGSMSASREQVSKIARRLPSDDIRRPLVMSAAPTADAGRDADGDGPRERDREWERGRESHDRYGDGYHENEMREVAESLPTPPLLYVSSSGQAAQQAAQTRTDRGGLPPYQTQSQSRPQAQLGTQAPLSQARGLQPHPSHTQTHPPARSQNQNQTSAPTSTRQPSPTNTNTTNNSNEDRTLSHEPSESLDLSQAALRPLSGQSLVSSTSGDERPHSWEPQAF